MSGTTLESFFPDSNKIYFQAEIDLLNYQICNLSGLTSPCRVNNPSSAQSTLISTLNHVQDNLNNWDLLVNSIVDTNLYWVPARNNLQRPSRAIGPVQNQIDNYAVTLENASATTIPTQLPDIIMARAGQEVIADRTYNVTGMTNQVNNTNLIPASTNLLLPLTLDFSNFSNLISYNGQQTTIRDLFALLGSNQNQNPIPTCSVQFIKYDLMKVCPYSMI